MISNRIGDIALIGLLLTLMTRSLLFTAFRSTERELDFESYRQQMVASEQTCGRLFAMLEQADDSTSRRLTDELLNLRYHSEKAAQQKIESYYVNVRNAAIEILGESRDASNLPYLKKILNDKEGIHPAATINLAKDAIGKLDEHSSQHQSQ